MSNVILVTTRWNQRSAYETRKSEKMELELKKLYAQTALGSSSSIERYKGDKESGLAILSMLQNRDRLILSDDNELPAESESHYDPIDAEQTPDPVTSTSSAGRRPSAWEWMTIVLKCLYIFFLQLSMCICIYGCHEEMSKIYKGFKTAPNFDSSTSAESCANTTIGCLLISAFLSQNWPIRGTGCTLQGDNRLMTGLQRWIICRLPQQFFNWAFVAVPPFAAMGSWEISLWQPAELFWAVSRLLFWLLRPGYNAGHWAWAEHNHTAMHLFLNVVSISLFCLGNWVIWHVVKNGMKNQDANIRGATMALCYLVMACA